MPLEPHTSLDGPQLAGWTPRVKPASAHVYAFQLTFGLMGVFAIVGAVVCWLLVRKKDHLAPTHIFSRRSRWRWANTGGGPGLTRKPTPRASGPNGPGH